MTIQVVKVTVSVPSELVKMADKVAKERKTSRSKVVASCLAELAKKRFEAEKHLAEETFDAQREVLPVW